MPRSRSSSSPTRSDVVLDQIRSDVLNGRLDPGSRLGFVDLGERYKVSTGVLREVLPRLVEQGLATSEPQLGFRVIDVSPIRLSRLTDARVAIETLVTREAVTHGDIAWEADVVGTHHALVRIGDSLTDGNIHEEWLVAHEAFHGAILRGCDNGYLVDIASRLRSISEVYRCWSRSELASTTRDLAHEHRQIMEAAIARDADRAVELTETHIRRTTELLLLSAGATNDVSAAQSI
ncbi:GntR family transcriptional regulator [Rhodococcus qingshengii]|jgi:DNA-binding GntR family transcriptional regulator|uniref:GntR family transcriptional regulator n=1 Tax=Rhodococcus erythropolis group TaxID=2840174 RepID=UPI00211162B3|nr:GntR family transcriptional regulator [Rhodococcus qingshengii]UUE28613.1 GntR family transcriptional regulator [Rhodococcus qingshengii]